MNPGKKLKIALWLLPALLAVPAMFASAALTGQQVYDQYCAGCHRLGSYDTSGTAPDLLGKGSLVGSKYTAGVSGHKGITLTASDITNVSSFLNNPTTTAPLAISTSTLPGATAGSAYSQTLAATGGKSPYTWSRSAGTLPTGLTLSSSGVISGTPTTAGTYSFTVKVTDSAATPASVTKALSITVSAAGTVSPLSVTTTSLPGGTAGTAYSQTLSATGGVTPYTWSYSGTLPSGIGITSAGTVTGTPTVSGTFSFTAKVTDSKGTAATQALSLTIAAAARSAMTTADKNLFINNCLNCHTPTDVQSATATQIQAAISNNTGGMGTSTLRALSSTDLNNIADALSPTPLPAWNCTSCHSSSGSGSGSGTTQSTGQQIYDNQCAGCHKLGTYDTSGSAPDLLGQGSLVSGKFTSAHYGITLSSTDISNVAAFLNNPTSSSSGSGSTSGSGTTTTQLTGKQLYDQDCAGCHKLGTYDTSGTAPDLYGDGSLVGSKYTAGVSGHKGITLSATDISNLASFLNNPTTTTASSATPGSSTIYDD